MLLPINFLMPTLHTSIPTSNLTLIYRSNSTPTPSSSSSPMDWFSWLSKTNLEPSLIYDYGVTFARNQLQLEDATFFNHEFLQSMGISIAKHRLEILKLAEKQNRGRRPKKISGVINNCLWKCVNKLVFREEASANETPKEPNWHYREKWREATVNGNCNNTSNNKPMSSRSRTIALSGPLDGRMNEKVVMNKVLRLSGPLDGGRMSERMMYTNLSPIVSRQMVGSLKSPRSSGPLAPRMMMVDRRSPRPSSRPSDARAESPVGYSPYVNKAKGNFDYDDDDHTLWPTLFQGLKPT